MSKSPAYQCYPKDLFSDLRCMALPNNQYGMYRKLIDIAWLENGLPDDPVMLAKAVGEPSGPFAKKHWPVLRTFFDLRADGRLTQKRQEEEREKQRRWAEKSAEGGRKGAATRAQAHSNHPSTTLATVAQPEGNIAFPSPSPTAVPPRKAPRRGAHAPGPGFGAFWSAYPWRVAKQAAIRAWNTLAPDDPLQARLLAAIAAQRQSGCLRARLGADGKPVILHPASWLNGARWEDESPVDLDVDDEPEGDYVTILGRGQVPMAQAKREGLIR